MSPSKTVLVAVFACLLASGAAGAPKGGSDPHLAFMNRCALEGKIFRVGRYVRCCIGRTCIYCRGTTPQNQVCFFRNYKAHRRRTPMRRGDRARVRDHR